MCSTPLIPVSAIQRNGAIKCYLHAQTFFFLSLLPIRRDVVNIITRIETTPTPSQGTRLDFQMYLTVCPAHLCAGMWKLRVEFVRAAETTLKPVAQPPCARRLSCFVFNRTCVWILYSWRAVRQELPVQIFTYSTWNTSSYFDCQLRLWNCEWFF